MTAIVLCWLLSLAAASGPVELVIGGITVTAEVADEPAERRQGLMGRTALPKNHGVVFVYPDEDIRTFWMKNTPLPLSIAFLDRLGRVVQIAKLKPHDTRSVSSEVPAMYALEMTAGWFEAHSVTIGQPVAGLPTQPR